MATNMYFASVDGINHDDAELWPTYEDARDHIRSAAEAGEDMDDYRVFHCTVSVNPESVNPVGFKTF